MNNAKKISSAVMAFILVLCVGYFSLMSPTSAWFYNSGVIDSEDSFIFGELSVDTKFKVSNNIAFDGATKLSDPNEILFDEVIKVNEVKVANTGTIPARIYTSVVNKGNSKGLCWFAFTDDMLVDSSVKNTITSILPELTNEALTEYNIGADGNSGHYILCRPGEVTTVKIATWVDYDAVGESLENGSVIDGYDVEISLIATQDVDGALQR